MITTVYGSMPPICRYLDSKSPWHAGLLGSFKSFDNFFTFGVQEILSWRTTRQQAASLDGDAVAQGLSLAGR